MFVVFCLLRGAEVDAPLAVAAGVALGLRGFFSGTGLSGSTAFVFLCLFGFSGAGASTDDEALLARADAFAVVDVEAFAEFAGS